MNKLILHSGGMDSLALILDYYAKEKTENIISLGFDYGQRNYVQENKAAEAACVTLGITRKVIKVPLDQITESSIFSSSNKEVANNHEDTKKNIVHLRNGIFLMFAASYAYSNNCNEIAIGACKEDYEYFRDCRPLFFNMMNLAIQAGITTPTIGNDDFKKDLENIDYCNIKHNHSLRSDKGRFDITIKTPFINMTKKEIMHDILIGNSIDIYKWSYSCYRGEELSCGECTTCKDRLNAFREMGMVDPIKYKGK